MDAPSCRPLPQLSVDGWDTPAVFDDCRPSADNIRKLYAQAENKVVLVETRAPLSGNPAHPKVGSGFFVGDGMHVVTNTHVAASGKIVDVIMKDGKRYHARIEKLDTTNDLAELSVMGLYAHPSRAVDITNVAKLNSLDPVYTFGHPDGISDVVLSMGTFRDRSTLSGIFNRIVDYRGAHPVIEGVTSNNPKEAAAARDYLVQHEYADLLPVINLTKSKDPISAQEANDYLASPREHVRMNIHHGDSGSLTLDSTGLLAGVAADRVNKAHAMLIPADKVQALVANPEQTFEFVYQTNADGSQALSQIRRKDGSNRPPVLLKGLGASWAADRRP